MALWPRLASPRRGPRRACAAALVLVAPSRTAAAGARAEAAFTVRDPRVTESSGLTASPLHPRVFHAHNDSGDAARVFARGSLPSS
jgi:hypothetical protein